MPTKTTKTEIEINDKNYRDVPKKICKLNTITQTVK